MADQAIRTLIYRFGAQGFLDALLLAQARAPLDAVDALARHQALAHAFAPPLLPFSGRDILAAGIPEGPRVAALLAAAEARWIAEDFPSPARARVILDEEIAGPISKG
jgi:hypothetical protein